MQVIWQENITCRRIISLKQNSESNAENTRQLEKNKRTEYKIF